MNKMDFLFPFSEKILPSGGSVTILGSTGSIGVNCLSVLDQMADDVMRPFKVKGLCANSNYHLLAQQAMKYQPEFIAIANVNYYAALKDVLPDFNGQILSGHEGVMQVAAQRSDYVMSAIVGIAGLLPTLAAAHKGTIIALANKECLVTGGALFLSHIAQKGSKIFPVDSEHNALYHLLAGENPPMISKYYITASGGAFRDMPLSDFDKITPDMAITHPNWNMGAKICVDSATMMNKGLELIEAAYLFNLTTDMCDAVLHPQSIVHGMIANQQGELKMLASQPDMKIPIFSSLNYGHNIDMKRRLCLDNGLSLRFDPMDANRYPLFALAKQVLSQGGAYPVIFNAAGEAAVALFLKSKISFVQIACFVQENVEQIGKKYSDRNLCNIQDVIDLDQAVKQQCFS